MKTLPRPLWQGRVAPRSAPSAVPRSPSRLRPLVPETFDAARRVLAGRPAHHTYLLGCMEQYGPALFQGPHAWLGLYAARTSADLEGVAYVGRTTHLGWLPAQDDAFLAELAAKIADHDVNEGVRAIVGPETLVASLVAVLRGRQAVARPAVDRGPQLLMQITAATLTPFARSISLYPAQADDLVDLFAADCEMVRDEIGIDTVAGSPDDYWDAGLTRVAERRTWSIRGADGALHFKADVAAESSEAAVIAGVFTVPGVRGRGIARAGVGELCHYLLRSVPRVILAVYDDNRPAIDLYRSLGFRVIDRARSAWFV